MNNLFAIQVNFKLKTYLEIKQIRSYSFPNLVGNIGGYMGLFLGYALLNFPALIIKLLKSISRIALKCNNAHNRRSDEENSSNIFSP